MIHELGREKSRMAVVEVGLMSWAIEWVKEELDLRIINLSLSYLSNSEGNR